MSVDVHQSETNLRFDFADSHIEKSKARMEQSDNAREQDAKRGDPRIWDYRRQDHRQTGKSQN